jgi:diacylglycerol kinase (ATP)
LKIAIILNGISLKKNHLYHEVLPALRAAFDTEVFETRTQNDATLLAAKAVDMKFDVVLAAGGDGTVHQVVNGILSQKDNYPALPTFGVIPLGSGNDFARCLGITSQPAKLVAALRDNKPRPVDVGRITCRKSHDSHETIMRYFINEADIGMGPEVVRKVMASGRLFGSAVAYYMAILATFATYKPLPIKASTPGWTWQGNIRTLAIANGNFYGNGLCIAPHAKPDDARFDTFICGPVSIFDFIRYSGDLKKGRHIRIPDIVYNQADAIELTSPGPCVIETDGEILGHLPANIALIHHAISVLY